jgi:carbamoyltransferase|tara:strand:- start:120 stop:1748 length:1629 start_codon:yes stop_codon:yes gene_type:complete
MINLALYGSHNAALAVEIDGKVVLVTELERIVNEKNQGLSQYKTFKADDILFYSKFLSKWVCDKFNVSEFDNVLYQNTDVNIGEEKFHLEKDFPAKTYIHCKHHHSHAAGAFYQSPYDKALIFSFDGGGNDGCFNIYLAKRGKELQLLKQITHPASTSPHEYLDLGLPYMLFGHYLGEIRQEIDVSAGNLTYPGKMMGLASYGNVREEWLEPLTKFFLTQMNGLTYEKPLAILGDEIGLVFDSKNRINGKDGQDLAASVQKAWEEVFLSYAKPFMKDWPDYPILITGGCALNIILNTRIKEEFNKEVFIGPNPNDCGLAAGMLLNNIKPDEPADLTYSGLKLLDIDTISEYIQNAHYCVSSFLDNDKLVDDLVKGKIVGVARGRSEHGPRALGNRSVLCNPQIPNMKDILNAKVKGREYYRPFAPVVRLEDVNKYFEFEGEARWMSFCPKVRKEYRDKLSEITHIDGTARVQTITSEQNPWLYEILTKMDKETGIGVLLNTSFNVAGKPILNTVRDAFDIFWRKELDALIIEDYYFRKRESV